MKAGSFTWAQDTVSRKSVKALGESPKTCTGTRRPAKVLGTPPVLSLGLEPNERGAPVQSSGLIEPSQVSDVRRAGSVTNLQSRLRVGSHLSKRNEHVSYWLVRRALAPKPSPAPLVLGSPYVLFCPSSPKTDHPHATLAPHPLGQDPPAQR